MEICRSLIKSGNRKMLQYGTIMLFLTLPVFPDLNKLPDFSRFSRKVVTLCTAVSQQFNQDCCLILKDIFRHTIYYVGTRLARPINTKHTITAQFQAQQGLSRHAITTLGPRLTRPMQTCMTARSKPNKIARQALTTQV